MVEVMMMGFHRLSNGDVNGGLLFEHNQYHFRMHIYPPWMVVAALVDV